MSNAERVIEVLNVLSGIEEIKEEDDLVNSLYLDSLSMVSLLLEIEDAFDIQLDESDMDPFELIKVSDVIDLVNKYCEAKAGIE